MGTEGSFSESKTVRTPSSIIEIKMDGGTLHSPKLLHVLMLYYAQEQLYFSYYYRTFIKHEVSRYETSTQGSQFNFVLHSYNDVPFKSTV